jgi:hypothetical protein
MTGASDVGCTLPDTHSEGKAEMPGIQSRGRRGSTVVPNWRWEDTTLDPYELRIAGWLASHADSWCEEHVTRNEIAQRLGMSAGKVSKAMERLVDVGIVAPSSTPGKTRSRIDRWVVIFDFDAWEKWSPGDHSNGHEVTVKRSRGDQHYRTTEKDHSDGAARKRPRNELWDALEAEMGAAETRTAQSLRGKAVRDLKEVGATPDEIHARCKAYRNKYRGLDLTETALLKHWSRLKVSHDNDGWYDPDTGAWMAPETKTVWR